MTRRLLAAWQFLTMLPIPGSTASPGQAAVFFPLTGAALGAFVGGVLLAAGHGFPGPIAALCALAALLLVTGCLHEDGLADVADAIRAGRSRDKILAILKDSRIGTYGAVALVVVTLLRWQALVHASVNPVYGLAAALAVSRSVMVVLAGITPACGEGLGRAFTEAISPRVVAVVIAQAAVLSLLAGWAYAVAMMLCSALIVMLARSWFIRRLGGVNGDCLGATCQVVETVNLVILAWQRSI